MVGAKGAQFPKEGVSQNYAPQFHDYVWSMANSMGYGHLFLSRKLSGGVVDDHLFINEIAQIPTINIINKPSDQSFGDHWHTQRSEEHTSELQSRGHLVCRLLLEKKKKK